MSSPAGARTTSDAYAASTAGEPKHDARADASPSALAVADMLPTCIDGWVTGKGQIALHRRKASSTAAWMLRLLTASPTR